MGQILCYWFYQCWYHFFIKSKKYSKRFQNIPLNKLPFLYHLYVYTLRHFNRLNIESCHQFSYMRSISFKNEIQMPSLTTGLIPRLISEQHMILCTTNLKPPVITEPVLLWSRRGKVVELGKYSAKLKQTVLHEQTWEETL